MDYISLNPEYILKKDDGRALIITKDVLRTIEPVVESVIHPIHAIILSFFDGRTILSNAIRMACEVLDVEESFITKFIDKITDNENTIGVKITDTDILLFPRKTLIRHHEPFEREKYAYSMFDYEVFNPKTDRHLTPSRITFMVTTQCYTDCIYCYADRRNNITLLPFERVAEVVAEARNLGVVSFDVIGGEFFLYKYWKELLVLLYQNNYTPFISTKVPIKLEEIEFLKKIGTKDIQISLDTLLPKHSSSLLRVNEKYVEKIKNTIKLLDEFGISIQIHTILTSLNDTVIDMESIFEFINNLSNIHSWKIDVAASTLYTSEEQYDQTKTQRDKLAVLVEYFENIKSKEAKFKIISGDINLVDNPNPNELSDLEKQSFFSSKREIFCAANYSSIFILPDGKVTICEELYWHPQFIIGDCSQDSIVKIWNSPKAKSLYYLTEGNMQENSPCKSCSILTKCRQEFGGVCWREVIKAYGKENWDFPDPRCPKAAKISKNIYV